MTRSRSKFQIVRRPLIVGVSLALAGGSLSCFPKPNRANIELRKQVQTLEDKNVGLERRHAVDVAQMRAMRSDRAVDTLPPDRLALLFTASAIKFKSIVIGEDLDPASPGDEGFKIGLTPVDQAGDEFKSSGSIAIELFDLAADPARIGSWTFTTAEAQPKWLSTFVFDGYIFSLPWQTPPAHDRLMVKATFTEELTGRVFEAEHALTIVPPTAKAAAATTTQPSGQP